MLFSPLSGQFKFVTVLYICVQFVQTVLYEMFNGAKYAVFSDI